MAREHDPKIVEPILALLASENATFDAVVGLSEAITVIGRVSQRLPRAQRIRLAEIVRDSADELEKRELVNVLKLACCRRWFFVVRRIDAAASFGYLEF